VWVLLPLLQALGRVRQVRRVQYRSFSG